MKRTFLFIVLVFFCVNICLSEDTADDLKKAQMDSFMGIKWGTVFKGFKSYIKEKTGRSGKRFKFVAEQEQDDYYVWSGRLFDNFLIIDFYVDLVFKFKITPERIKELREKHKKEFRVKLKMVKTSNLSFHSVTILCSPDNFIDLFEILKIRYGQPTNYTESKIQNNWGAELLQKEAIWLNEKLKRKIVMKKYATSITESSIQFSPHDKDYLKKRMKYLKEAANLF